MEFRRMIFGCIFCVSGTCLARPYIPIVPKSPAEFDGYFLECREEMRAFKQYTFGFEALVHDAKERIEWILENKDSQIKEVIGGRIYLRPESIIYSDYGIFLRIQDFIVLKVPSLLLDEKGPYISLVN